MEQKTAIGLTALVLALIISIFAYYRWLDLDIGPFYPGAIDHQPTLESVEELASSLLASEKIIGLRIPDNISWERGETGSFALAIRNRYSEPRTFHFKVSPEGAGMEQWIIYPSKKAVQAGEVETITIIARPLALPGNYLFRIFVCETSDCSGLSSPSLYATTTFSFRII